MSRNGPMGYRVRPRGRNSRGPKATEERHDVFFKCDVCDKARPGYRPCLRDTYSAQPFETNYHLGQQFWADSVITSGQTFVFDKDGRRHNLTYFPGDKPYNTLRQNLIKWRYRAFGSCDRIKELSRSNRYRFNMADQVHWHQDTDTSIRDPVARRNVITLKDTEGRFHEVFVLNPTPDDELKALEKWTKMMRNIWESVMGYTGPFDGLHVPRYLWARPEEEVGSPGAPGVVEDPGPSGQAFRLDLPRSERAQS